MKVVRVSLFLCSALIVICFLLESSSAFSGGLMYLEKAEVDYTKGIFDTRAKDSKTTTTHKTQQKQQTKGKPTYGTLKKAPKNTGLSKQEEEFFKNTKIEGGQGIEQARRKFNAQQLQKLTLLNMVDTMRDKAGSPLFNNNKDGRSGNSAMSDLLQEFKETTTTSFDADFSRQVQGDYRGGLIPFSSLEWEYSARDASQFNGPVAPRRRQQGQRADLQMSASGNPTTTSFFGNQEDSSLCIKKSIDRASVALFDGALKNVPYTEYDVCNSTTSYFNGVLEVPINQKGTVESILFFFGGAVISKYALLQSANRTEPLYEQVCFDYPVLAYSYARMGEVSPVEHIAHSCHEGYCDKYRCACKYAFAAHDSFNIAPLFCNFFDFYQIPRPLPG